MTTSEAASAQKETESPCHEPAPRTPKVALTGDFAASTAAGFLGNVALSGRANAGVRTLAMRQTQQTHGNYFAQRAISGRFIQRHCTCGGTCEKCRAEEEDLSASPAESSEESTRLVQRQAIGPSTLATIESSGNKVIPPGSGESLDEKTRAFMESRFDRDFGDVRVHIDTDAAESAEALSADAYATGRDIYFAAGKYAPESSQGQHLLAHELTHVVQQAEGQTRTDRALSHPDDESEREARGVSEGLSVAALSAPRARLQRQASGSVDPTQDNPPPGPAMPLPSPSLIEQKAPVATGDLIKFESVLLSADTEFVRFQLEQMIAYGGFNVTASFVQRLVSSPGEDESSLAASEKLRQALAQSGASDVSGAPLAPQTEEEIRHRMANKDRVRRVIPVVEREFKLLRTEAEEFLADFEMLAKEKMFDALRESQGRVEDEAKRYGISPAELASGPELKTTAFPKPETAADITQKMRGQQADVARYRAAEKPRQELIKAAVEVRRRKEWVKRLEAQLQSVRNPSSGYAFPKPLTPLDVMKEFRAEEELRKAKLQFDEFLHEKQREFPILAAFAKDGQDLSKLADTKGEDLKGALLEQVNDRIKNIFETRENMRAGRITPWQIPFVVEATRLLMKVDKGTMRARVLDDWYNAKKQEKVDEKEQWQAVSTLSFALGLLAIIPTPLTPLLALGSTVLGVAVAAHDLDEYILQSAASGTDFDKALAISQEDPSLFWVAVELIGTALDLGGAAKSLRGISTLKRAVVAGEEGAVKALEAEASKLGPQVAERLVAEAEAARRAAMAEARTAGRAAQVVEEEVIKAGKLAEQTFEHGGHTYQILKDGRIVRCSKWCTDLDLLFGDLFKRNPHLAEELKKVRALKGKAAAEAAAGLTERMEQIRRAESMSLDELEKLLDKPEFAKGTSKGDDLRYVRYQKKGGELGFGDWFSSSRGGRLGGVEHQEIVAEIQKKFPNTEPERAVANRFADAYTPAQGGKKAIYHQVGGTNIRGDPIARERRAIDEIRRAVGDDADIIFYPKDKSLPLVNPDRDPRFAKTWKID